MINTSASRLSLAVLLSLAVHGLVVMVWPDNKTNIPQAGGQEMTVSLVVLANKKSPAPEIEKPSKTEQTTKTTAHQQKVIKTSKLRPEAVVKQSVTPIPKTDPIKSVQPSSIVTNTIHADTVEKITTASPPSDSSNKLLESVLRKAFNTHFYYPRLAIRRGWSGEVHISLRIESNGTLSHVRILKGSGFGLLDKAAMSSLDKVEILPSAIALLNGNSFDLVLPVEYRLL